MNRYQWGKHRLEIIIDGERLAAMRHDRRMTQLELAQASGLSAATVARIEETADTGKAVYSKTWRLLCRGLKLRTDEAKDSILKFEVVESDGSGGVEPVSELRQLEEEQYMERHGG